ncbi:YeiH family putative sulfate export transporter [Actinomyces sp. zg-332]|uniref:YeiH family protein n=1 Tax=Actinomyces sp. zg-332 TaxID=2708340 RepID=UPI0014236A00|nr:YeiH family protein [Actinomyces sp. zg-332]QPK93777.1 YeiH family putative sulfate export transporter [Actinomyces sp. zg-332]
MAKIKGISVCLLIAIPSLFLGKLFPIIGAPVFAILIGISISSVLKDKFFFLSLRYGITFTSKVVLQWAVILLGFGLNLNVILKVGKQSLPIIIFTISGALLTAFVLYKVMNVSRNLAILIGVGSSICGGSAIAATAPVIKADDTQIAHSISVIFLFNVLAALIFPNLGMLIGFDTLNPDPFAIFAGTAVNDTSSVTATASTWDSLHHLGSQTLDKAVTVKLTRTLAIIPITFALSLILSKSENNSSFSFKKSFPMFIVYFLLASIFTTVSSYFGMSAQVFDVAKEISKFLIVLAMSAIGLNTNISSLLKSGYKPIFLGLVCWIMVAVTSLASQRFLGIW